MPHEHEPIEPLDPALALRRMDVIDRRTRATARWPAVCWLVLAVAFPVFLIGERVATGPVLRVVEWLPLAAVIAVLAIATTRRAESRIATRLSLPAGAACVGLALACMVAKWTVLPDGYSPGLVVLGVLPALPCVYAAVRTGLLR